MFLQVNDGVPPLTLYFALAATMTHARAACADVASGSSEDWARAVAGVKYTYTIELRDNGTYGFLLPAEFIDVSGAEMFNALNTLSAAVLQSSPPTVCRVTSPRRHQLLQLLLLKHLPLIG